MNGQGVTGAGEAGRGRAAGTRVLAAALLASAITAVAASSAVALPEYARCLAHPGGKYSDANCQAKVANGKGAYELSKVVEHTGVSGHGSVTWLETVGGSELRCTASSWTGNLDVVKGVTRALNHVVIRFTGCELPLLDGACGTPGAPRGEIVTSELEGKLGYISKTARTVEQELKPMSTAPGSLFLEFQCGGGAVLIKMGKGNRGGGGCIYTPVEPTNVMTSALTEQLTGSAGVQSPNKLEGSGKLCNLESTANGSPWERGSIGTAFSLTPGEGIEIRA